jgi:hypothetical protein
MKLPKSYKRIEKALDVLFAEGVSHYDEGAKAGADRSDAIGLAIAEVMRSPRQILQMTYSALEDMNSHAENMVIDLLGNLYPHPYPLRNWEALAGWLSRRGVAALGDWDDGISDYKKIRINVRVIIEEAADEAD